MGRGLAVFTTVLITVGASNLGFALSLLAGTSAISLITGIGIGTVTGLTISARLVSHH